jgi:hypothetical protein
MNLSSESVDAAMHDADVRHFNDAVAAGLAGLIAGTVYLLAQTTFTLFIGLQSASEPIQRIAAILLGPDAAPPPAELSLTIVGMALLIHLPLAFVYGRLIGRLVRDVRPFAAVAIGAAFGLAMYGLNFELIAPKAFSWFEASRGAITLFDHALFGAVAAAAFVLLRRRLHLVP